MTNWESALVGPDTCIREAVSAIDRSRIQIALVVDDCRRLLGTITDGDVRRGILRGVPFDAPASAIMNAHPTVARTGDSPDSILETMKRTTLRCIPILNAEGRIRSVSVLNELLVPRRHGNPVVLMAGGMGTRLAPITRDIPKPLINIGGKPILETILEGLKEHGFENFFVSVNYKAEMVKDHFGDGSEWGVSIRYLEEECRLGTAGPLSLLPAPGDLPILVMNGDLLTKVDFGQLISFHCEHKAAATMCVREYEFKIPYGVVRTDHHRISSLDEKPVQRMFVNAGIYVLDPLVLELVPRGDYYDMTTLFQALLDSNRNAIVFPLREYWLDVGRMDDLERAQMEYGALFDN